eukprot:5832736-Pyramimonas_sp.AAC.1
MRTLPRGFYVELSIGLRIARGMCLNGRGSTCERCHWDLEFERWSSDGTTKVETVSQIAAPQGWRCLL